ncbi:MAG: pyridoxamine 5'-phosphate oxidase family protein [Croceibacterium sp.]
MPDTAQIKHAFWKALADSPFVFLQLDADPATASPMTAQLDEDANHAIWFFTRKSGVYAAGGPAVATFAAKGHAMFARIAGTLSEETSHERLDKQWSQIVEAWFPGGKTDPDLLMLRLDLGQAEIWEAKLGVIGTAKMLLGFDVRDETAGHHVETAL